MYIIESWRRFSLPPPVITTLTEDVTTTILDGKHFGTVQSTGTIAGTLDDASVVTTAVSWTNTQVVFAQGADPRDTVSVIVKNWLGYMTRAVA